MATINLGAIKFNWKGAYNNGTTYAVDDVVSSGGNSYVCIQASTGNAVGNATAYWNIMASSGAEGGTTTLTTRGDVLYKGASTLERLPKGTAGYFLKQGANDPEWGAVDLTNLSASNLSSGTIPNARYGTPTFNGSNLTNLPGGGKILQVIQKSDITSASFTGSGGNSPEEARCITHLEQVITPSASSSKILITVTICGSGGNDAFANIAHKTSSFVGLGFGSAQNGTLVHATSPNGQTPALSGDYENDAVNTRLISATYSFLHSPNTTSAIYYMPTMTTWSGTSFYYNRAETDGTAGWYGAGMSTITLMEIGA